MSDTASTPEDVTMTPEAAAMLIAEHGQPELLATGHWSRLTHPAFAREAHRILGAAVQNATSFGSVDARDSLLAALASARVRLGLGGSIPVARQAVAS